MNKKLLSIIALIMVLCFAFVSCGEPETPPVVDPCANGHTFESGDAWQFDETMHWHKALCNHKSELGDVQGHIDENIDGACDVCGYDRDHEHSFEAAWTVDETSHWHKSDCYHKVIDSKGAHTPNVMGICTVCNYVVSDPDIDSVKDAVEVGSSQGSLVENGMFETGYGYYEEAPILTYEGSFTITEQTAEWGVEGEYDFVIYTDGTYSVTQYGEEVYLLDLYLDEETSLYELSFGDFAIWMDFMDYALEFYNEAGSTAIAVLDGTFTVEDPEGNVWATLVFDGEEVDQDSLEPSEPILTTEATNSGAFEFRDGYFYAYDYESEYYFSETENGEVFAVRVYWDYEGNLVTERMSQATLDNLKGYQFPTDIVGRVDGISFYGVEDLVKTLYSMGATDNFNDDFSEEINEDGYMFSFGYYNSEASELIFIEVSFTLDLETYTFENVGVKSSIYGADKISIRTEGSDEVPATWEIIAGKLPDSVYYIMTSQNIEEEAPENEYNPDSLLMKDFDLVTGDDEVIDEVITIVKGYTTTLYFANVNPTSAEYIYNTIVFMLNGEEEFDGILPWYNVGDDFVTFNAYCEAGSEFTLTMVVNGYERSYKIVVVDAIPTEILAGTTAPYINEWDQETGSYILEELDSITVEEGVSKLVVAHVNQGDAVINFTITPEVAILDGDLTNEPVLINNAENTIRTTGFNTRNLPVDNYVVTFTVEGYPELTATVNLEITEKVNTNGLDGKGTLANPYVMEELGTQVAEVASESSVFYVYTVENDTTIIISSENGRRYISYAVNDPEAVLGTISSYGGTTAIVNLTAGDSLYIEVGTIDGNSGNVEFEIAEPSDEVIDITGEYESNNGTKPLTVIVDDETVTFIYGSNTQTFKYSMQGDVVTIYQADGVTPWNSMMIALVITDGKLTKATYNGNSFPLTKTSSGGSEGGDEGDDVIELVGGEYHCTNEFMPATLDVTIDTDAGTVTFVYNHPMTGPRPEVVAYYTVNADGTVSLADADGVALNPLMGTITVDAEGVLATASYEGYTFTPVSEGGNEGGTGTGAENDPYLIDSIPAEVVINSDTSNLEYFYFTAEEDGTIVVTFPNDDGWVNYFLYNPADGSVNGQVSASKFNCSEFSFDVTAGNSYRVGLGTWDIPGTYTVTINYDSNDEGGDEGETGSGTGAENDPYLIESIPADVVINSDISNLEFFYFTAEEDGTIVVTFPNDDGWVNYFLYNPADGSVNGQVSGSKFNCSEYKFDVVAGNAYRVGLATWDIPGTYTVSIAYGEPDPAIEVEDVNMNVEVGTIEVPAYKVDWESLASYITFTAEEDGTYTLSFADEEYNGEVYLVIGEDEESYVDMPYAFALKSGDSITFAVYYVDYDNEDAYGVVDLELARTADYPTPVEEYELLYNGEAVNGTFNIEAGISYYLGFNIIAPAGLSMDFVTITIDGENLNAEFDMDNMAAYQNCLFVEYQSYSGQLYVKTLKAPVGTTFTVTIALDDAVNTYTFTVVPTCPTEIVASGAEAWWGMYDLTGETDITINEGDEAYIGAYANRNIEGDLEVYLNGTLVNANAYEAYTFYSDEEIECPGAVINLSTLTAGEYTFTFKSKTNAEISAEITVTVTAPGGDATVIELVSGEYHCTNSFMPATLDVTIDAEAGTVTLVYNHPMTGPASPIVAYYTVNADGTVTLANADGVALNPLMGSITVDADGILTAASCQGYSFTPASDSGDEGDDDDESTLSGSGLSFYDPIIADGDGTAETVAGYYSPAFIEIAAGVTVTITGDAYLVPESDPYSDPSTTVTANATELYLIFSNTESDVTVTITATLGEVIEDGDEEETETPEPTATFVGGTGEDGDHLQANELGTYALEATYGGTYVSFTASEDMSIKITAYGEVEIWSNSYAIKYATVGESYTKDLTAGQTIKFIIAAVNDGPAINTVVSIVYNLI